VGDVGSFREFQGFADAGGTEINPDATTSPPLGGCGHDPSIAAAEIVDHILPGHLGQFQHGMNDVFRGGHIDDVQIVIDGAEQHRKKHQEGPEVAGHGAGQLKIARRGFAAIS
jgi:hypothetical protein